MAKQKDSAKGNPAHKRIGNAHRKAYRATCWARQERRKDQREAAQLRANQHNMEVKARGELTAWEISQHNRHIKRFL